MPKKLSIVVPVYFNAESLPLLHAELRRLEEELISLQMEMELILVDDGSGDTSWQEMKRIKEKRPDTRLVRLARNFGAVHASKTGMQFVTGDCFLVLAADLQDPPSLVTEMVRRWLQGEKFVICIRRNREDPLLTRLFSKLYYRIIRMFVTRDYPERGYDLALMDRAFLPYLQNSAKNINTLLYAYWLGFSPSVIGYDRRKRAHGRSRWTFGKKLKFFLDSILGFSMIPMRFISSVGLAVSFLSFLYGISVIFNAVAGRKDVPGFPTIVALLTFLIGLVIIMLGIIGEYLWRIYDEVGRRPEAVIDEIL